jgi:hypothetical protein
VLVEGSPWVDGETAGRVLCEQFAIMEVVYEEAPGEMDFLPMSEGGEVFERLTSIHGVGGGARKVKGIKVVE